jgi:ketosteroid isomerase-like protein
MPSDIELLQTLFEAVNSEDIERVLALTHDDFEVAVPPELSTEPDVYRGVDGMRRYWESFQEALEEIRFQPGRVADTGRGVLVEMHVTARGRQTGIRVDQELVGIWEMRDGKAHHIRVFPSLDGALEALGLDRAPPDASWQTVGS